MYVAVDAAGAVLHEADDTGRLHVTSTVAGAELDAALRAAGAGYADADAAWLDLGYLRAGTPHAQADGARFAAMLDLARRHGWLTDDGAHVRAHVVAGGDTR